MIRPLYAKESSRIDGFGGGRRDTCQGHQPARKPRHVAQPLASPRWRAELSRGTERRQAH
jgi:hypothetical protein